MVVDRDHNWRDEANCVGEALLVELGYRSSTCYF